MILARAPLRITLGGGGTDLPAFADTYGGLCLGMAIQQYVYVAVHKNFDQDLIVKYSQLERVPDASKVVHPIIRETLGFLGQDGRGIEITSMADVPAGLGLGSSSAFTVALLAALSAHYGRMTSAEEVARDACVIEIERVGSPIGRQDQYLAALGGCQLLSMVGGFVSPRAAPMPVEVRQCLRLYPTGMYRSAVEVLQNEAAGSPGHYERLRYSAVSMLSALARGDVTAVGAELNCQWELKSERQTYPISVINQRMAILEAGARGVKLVGAGGGGCLLACISSAQAEPIDAPRIPLLMDTEGVFCGTPGMP